MNKRLRKKKRLGEFNWLGFKVHVAWKTELSNEEIHAFYDAYIPFVEKHDFGVHGLISERGMEQYVAKMIATKRRMRGWRRRFRDAHCTEQDRLILLQWLQSHPNVAEFVVGPLRPGWHTKD